MLLATVLLALTAGATAAATPTVEDDRLRSCLQQAVTDSPTALAAGDRWLAESRGSARSKPLQCLGHVYTVLLRWQAAEDAFVAAVAAAPAGDPARVAKLWAQAGNAALAGGHAERALTHFEAALARADATLPAERGEIELDRARALVALDRAGEAGEALTAAQRDAPDEPLVWLLSATLSRRQGDLAAAQRQIEVAVGLAPNDPDIGLEAGAIAMLAGRDDAARQSWRSVLLTAPESKAAATAKGYLAQLGASASAGPSGR